MPLKVTSTKIPDVLLIEPAVFRDERGYFLETYHQRSYTREGIAAAFVQDNHSHSRRGVLRGLHYQLRHAQGKLLQVVKGEVFDVAVDIRRGSPTFARWVGVTLSEKNQHQLYIPPGFAHGFYVLSETADVRYKCTDFYVPEDEYGLLWSDGDIAIDWPLTEDPQLSAKDHGNPRLRDVPDSHLAVYRPS